MSLVNDALKRARLEAARQQATRQGLALPLGEESPRPLPKRLLAIAALLLVVLVGAALLLYLAGRRSAAPGDQVADKGPASEAAPPAAGATERPAIVVERPPLPETVEVEAEPYQPPTREPATGAESHPAGRAEGVSQAPGRRETLTAASSPQSVDAAPKPIDQTVTDRPPEAGPAATAPPSLAAVDDDSQPETAPLEAPTLAEELRGSQTDSPVFVRETTIPGIGRLELGGIAWSETRPFALINGRVVGAGESVGPLMLVDIRPRHVEFRGEDGTFFIRLR